MAKKIKFNAPKIKRFLLGRYGEYGFLTKILLYAILIGISFIFLYPILQMIVTSFMGLEDLIDPTTIWIPSSIQFKNYKYAFETLNFTKALSDSIKVSLLPTIFGVISSGLIGYGFAHYEFPGKKIWLALVVVVFLIPTLLLNIPTFVLYNDLGLLNSLKAYIYPAMTGYGLRQSVFILIFFQFFKMMPKELSESAEVDGANAFQIFIRIAVPMAVPAIIICTLYSFVWYWNETSLATSYFGKEYRTLQMAVVNFEAVFRENFGGGNLGLDSAYESFNQGVLFAGTMLSILPLLILYTFTQKWFVESADKVGIAGN